MIPIYNFPLSLNAVNWTNVLKLLNLPEKNQTLIEEMMNEPGTRSVCMDTITLQQSSHSLHGESTI